MRVFANNETLIALKGAIEHIQKETKEIRVDNVSQKQTYIEKLELALADAEAEVFRLASCCEMWLGKLGHKTKIIGRWPAVTIAVDRHKQRQDGTYEGID